MKKAAANAEIAEVEFNEEELDMDAAGEPQAEEGELDPVQTQQERKERLSTRRRRRVKGRAARVRGTRKLRKNERWLCGRKAASVKEDDFSRKLTTDGLKEAEQDPPFLPSRVVHDDNFTFARTESDLRKIKSKMCG